MLVKFWLTKHICLTVNNVTFQVMTGAEPPPSYDSLFGKIKDARNEHGNSFGFLKALAAILGAAIGGKRFKKVTNRY